MVSEKRVNKNGIRAMLAIVVIILVMIIGTSFALWQITLRQNDKNIITTSCLKVNMIEDSESISLQNAYPTSDSDGKSLTPFTFTLENVCDAATSYVVNLETLAIDGKVLADNYVKVDLLSGTQEVFFDTLNGNYENLEKVISDSVVAYKVAQGRLHNKDKITFNLRIWLDSNTPLIDEVMNASWQGKITVTAEYVPPVKEKNLMIPIQLGVVGENKYYNVSYTQNKKYDISTVSFESVLNPYIEAVEIVDFSEAQNKSVLGYYVKDEGLETYTLHIQADGKIKANANADYYCMVNNVVGLENLDTSLVKSMAYMFMYNKNTSLDLTVFDTSNVENMRGMFYGYLGESINFTNFNTSNVKDMAAMFYYANNLSELNINHFDTSNVVDMNHMFLHCIGLTTLDLSEWNTSKLEDMHWMFAWANNLTSIKMDNFDTSKVKDMSDLFLYLFKLTAIDLSMFDTSSVENFDGMFIGISKNTDIIYSEKFIYNDGASVDMMFDSNDVKKPTHPSWSGII